MKAGRVPVPETLFHGKATANYP